MRRFLKVFGIVGGAVAVAIGLSVVGARLNDGPIGIVPGGPLESGEWVTGAPSPAEVRDVPTIEWQLLEPPRSRTTWIVEHDGRLFIPSGYMDSTLGRWWKRWPLVAEQDGRAIVRIDGKRYRLDLVRISSGPVVEPVTAALAQKYGVGATPAAVHNGSLWIFELVAPNGDSTET